MALFTKDRSFYRSLILLAVPISLQNLVTFAVNFADNVMIGSLGDDAISGVYVGGQLQSVVQMFVGGIEGAILILAAQYWGRKDRDSIRKVVSIGVKFALGVGLFTTLVAVLFPQWVIRIFTTEPGVIREGAAYVQIVGFTYLFFSVSQVMIAAMRSVETARLLAGPDRPVQIEDDLRELDMGCWEGKSFASIRKEYPQLYTARGSDHALQPPGGESYSAAAARMERALNAIAAGLDSQEERVVVSHSGAMRAFLCKATGTPYSQNRTWSQPYGSVDVLEYGPAGWKLLAAGVSPYRCPDEGQVQALWEEYGAGQQAQLHCRAVAEKAVQLCRSLAAAGWTLDEELLRAAALLHDLRRQEKQHAQAAARLLRQKGYFRVAAVVSAHEGPDDAPQLNEEGLLYLADKLVQGQREVGLEARFAASREKCRSAEALQQHERRLRQARLLEAMVRERVDSKDRSKGM